MNLPLHSVLPGNCIEILTLLPENSVDLVFVDPPYNLQLQNDLYRPNRTKVDAVNNSWDKFSSFAEYDRVHASLAIGMSASLKERGTIWVIGHITIFTVGVRSCRIWVLDFKRCGLDQDQSDAQFSWRTLRQFPRDNIWAQKRKALHILSIIM